jgi:hypothetical protein
VPMCISIPIHLPPASVFSPRRAKKPGKAVRVETPARASQQPGTALAFASDKRIMIGNTARAAYPDCRYAFPPSEQLGNVA